MPEIKDKFEEETSWQDGMDTGSHLVFEDVLSPFVIDHCEEKILMTRLFDFIEELLEMDDFYVLNVVTVSFVESVVYNTDPRCFFEYMHPKTMEIAQDYQGKTRTAYRRRLKNKNDRIKMRRMRQVKNLSQI